MMHLWGNKDSRAADALYYVVPTKRRQPGRQCGLTCASKKDRQKIGGLKRKENRHGKNLCGRGRRFSCTRFQALSRKAGSLLVGGILPLSSRFLAFCSIPSNP